METRDRATTLTIRRELILRLNRTAANFVRWKNARGIRPPNVFDDFFKALADAGDFNRRHPDIPIPAMSNDRVPEPVLGAAS